MTADPWQVKNTCNETEAKNDTTHTHIESNGVLADSRDSEKSLQFEDDFAANICNNVKPLNHNTDENNQVPDENNSKQQERLPDSDVYLQTLEKKLQKLQKGHKLISALAEKRQQCMRTLLQESDEQLLNSSLNPALLDLDISTADTESAVHSLYRHLQPVQALTLGETLRIVDHDQLEEQQQSEAGPENSTGEEQVESAD